MADGVVGLLFCILLILMLLILYLMRAKDYDFYGDNIGAYDRPSEEEGAGGGYGATYEREHAEPSGGGEGDDEDYEDGGGGGYMYEDPDPGAGEGDGSDKAAVLVQVVDGETKRTIKKEGIKFELYNSESALQVLSTYYPTKVDYKRYETDQDGVFYLPEKIRLGTYYLHDLTPVEGYDAVGNWEFAPDRDYDWDDPYLVSVELYPARNIIRLQLNDADTGEKITGASFDIVAAENITTKDGTTRYKQGDIVDTVAVDDQGYGESKELYLGKYLIRQNTAPEYYSCLQTDTSVEVKSKASDATPALNELKERKTTILVTVTDALYENKTISGATFDVTTETGEKVGTYTSDESGQIALTDLIKGSTYHVKQTASVSKYKIDPSDHAFTVDSKGLINLKEAETLTVANGIVRTKFSVRDQIFKREIADVDVVLQDGAGKSIQSWTTSGADNVLEGLDPGEYRVVIDGNESKSRTINVEDTVDVQTYTFYRWTTVDIGIVFAAALAAIGLLAGAAFWLRHRSNTKAEE